jgi:ABC-type dipeptide/oligopeptide/nickel transport system permease subunit
MLFFLVPIEDIPVVIVIVIINSFLYEYLRTASISLLREDDRRYISAARFSGVVQNARVLKQRESERERERTHASKI